MKDYKTSVLPKKHFSKEQLELFRGVIVADFLNWYEPGSVILKDGSYRLKNNESMVLNGIWARDFSVSECRDAGRRNPVPGLDAVMQLCGLNFFQATCAVNDFLNSKLPSTCPPLESELTFEELERRIKRGEYSSAKGNFNVFAYLTQTRHMPAELVEEYISEGLLYVEELPKGYNLLFTMHSSQWLRIVHGFERCGILSYQSKKYKGSIVGVPKCYFYNFIYPNTDCGMGALAKRRVLVFESALDAMAFHALVRMGKIILPPDEQLALLSLRGVHYSILEHFLDEDADNVYETFEAGERQYINEVTLCVDNDKAGDDFCKTVEAHEAGAQYYVTSARELLTRYGVKDWNELLIKSGEIVSPIDFDKVTTDYTLDKTMKI